MAKAVFFVIVSLGVVQTSLGDSCCMCISSGGGEACALPGICSDGACHTCVARGGGNSCSHACGCSSLSSPSPPAYPPNIVNKTYGYPDGLGALIIENPFPYEGGPIIWSGISGCSDGGKACSDEGAIALLLRGPQGKKDADCAAMEDDFPLASSGVRPFVIDKAEHQTICGLACDKSAAAAGKDPCAAASITGPSNSMMSCYDIGSEAPPGYGVCGYNCTFWSKNPPHRHGCSKEEQDQGLCYWTCDTRELPFADDVSMLV